MLRKSLDALVNLNAQLAHEVWNMDDEVDDLHRATFSIVKKNLCGQPEHIDGLINLLSVSRNLERIADLATNIAEDVIYLLEGKVVRHRLQK